MKLILVSVIKYFTSGVRLTIFLLSESGTCSSRCLKIYSYILQKLLLYNFNLSVVTTKKVSHFKNGNHYYSFTVLKQTLLLPVERSLWEHHSFEVYYLFVLN